MLSGGAGDDQYIIKNGVFTIIADLGGGVDTVTTSLDLSRLRFSLVNQRDLLCSDGLTTVLIYDPLGAQDSKNAIEKVVASGSSYSTQDLYAMALNSSNFQGYTTYSDLESSGALNFTLTGLNPLLIDAYASNGKYNNTLVL